MQTSLQRQNFLLNYLKTLSVGPARVKPVASCSLSRPALSQLSQPHISQAQLHSISSTVQPQSTFRISSDNILVPSSLRNCFIFKCEIVNQEFQNCTTCYGELLYWRGRQWKTGCDNAPPVLSDDFSDALL